MPIRSSVSENSWAPGSHKDAEPFAGMEYRHCLSPGFLPVCGGCFGLPPVCCRSIRNRKPEREGVDGSAVHRTGRNRNGGIKSRVFELSGLFAEKQQIQLLRIDRRFRSHSSRPDLLAIPVSGNTELDGKVRRDRNTTARILSTPRYQYAKYAQKHGELRQRLPEKYG